MKKMGGKTTKENTNRALRACVNKLMILGEQDKAKTVSQVAEELCPKPADVTFEEAANQMIAEMVGREKEKDLPLEEKKE